MKKRGIIILLHLICVVIPATSVFLLTKAPEYRMIHSYRINSDFTQHHVMVKYVWSKNRLDYVERLIVDEYQRINLDHLPDKLDIFLYHDNKEYENGQYFFKNSLKIK